MKIYLVVNIILGVLGLIVKTFYIGKNEYPRITEYSIRVDLASLLITIGFIVWAGLLYCGII